MGAARPRAGGAALQQLGIESHSLTVRDAERISGLTRARVVPTADLVERLRAVKSPEEVAAIRAAAELAQEALEEVLPGIRAGPDRDRGGRGPGRRAPAARKRVASLSHYRRLGTRVGLPPCADQRAGCRRLASCCCSTSVLRWTDTAPTSPAPWWSERAADDRQRTVHAAGPNGTAPRDRAPAPGDAGSGGRRAGPRCHCQLADLEMLSATRWGTGLVSRCMRHRVWHPPRKRPCRRTPWSLSSRASIFQAGAEFGWRTMSISGPTGPSVFRTAGRSCWN